MKAIRTQQIVKAVILLKRRRTSTAAFADIMGERFIDVKVERLPWADKYWENGKVPDEALLAHGWSVSCYKCGKMVDIDTVVLIDTRGALCKECAGKDGK